MRALRLLLALVFTPFATVAALTARTAFSNPALRATPSWILRDSVEGFSAVEAIALLAVGMIARAVGGRGATSFRSVNGLVPTMAFATLAALSLIDASLGGDHNLIGLEWIIYGFFSGIVWLGVRLASLMAAQL